MEFLIKKYKSLHLNKTDLFFVFVICFLYLWGIGNPDAPRQGTEGFYLQISKEMFNQNSLLTPIHLGQPHWSKPPLHFWFPFPLYLLMGSNLFLLAARLTIFFLFLVSSVHISLWMKKYFATKFIFNFTFLAATFGFLKYSRIFMMEIPLSLITFSSLLLFYDYIQNKKKSTLIISSLLLGLSILVKGPVSFALTFLSLGVFHLILLFKKKEGIFVQTFKYTSIGFLIGSLWFVACYIEHGQTFIDYFFLRENLGKFTAKSYPIRSVIQGLIIYALPWSLFTPLFFKINYKKLKDNHLFLYMLSCFSVFFIVWMIPSQRSHHYALPALPFFLILIFQSFLELEGVSFKDKFFKVIHYLFLFFIIFFIGLFSFALSLKGLPEDPYFILKMILLIIFLGFCGILLFKKKINTAAYNIGYLCFFGSIYSISLTSFLFPTVPNIVIDMVQNETVATVYRKPYFIADALNREIIDLNQETIKNHLKNNVGFYIMREDVYIKQNLSELAPVVYKWPVWQRGNKTKDIFFAMRNSDLSSLKENLVLLKKTQP